MARLIPRGLFEFWPGEARHRDDVRQIEIIAGQFYLPHEARARRYAGLGALAFRRGRRMQLAWNANRPQPAAERLILLSAAAPAIAAGFSSDQPARGRSGE
jgi:hypothetical protein